MSYTISYACISHPGKFRQVNQDNFICDGTYMPPEGNDLVFPLCGSCDSDTPALFGVFDGLGGEQAGEMASYLAAKQASCLERPEDGTDALLAICKNVNQAICDFSSRKELRSVGTTAAMILFGDKISLCNIGDSRIFRFHRGSLKQLSVDHVYAAPFGIKPPLSQSLGIPPETATIQPSTLQTNYAAGDLYLICSDGVTDMLSVEEIRAVLAASPMEQAAQQLLDQALEKGGIDNTTILLCKIEKNRRSLFHKILFRKREE